MKTDGLELARRIEREIVGSVTWYAMNADESAYSMVFDRRYHSHPERDAQRWMADMEHKHPGYVKETGLHIVSRVVFTPAEELAREAAAMLRPWSGTKAGE